MKTIAAICTLIPSLLLIACGTDETKEEPSDDLSGFTVTASQAESVKEHFVYRLASEKEQYTEGEEIEIYAELEYTGEEKSMEISHAASPFYFPIHEETRDYSVEYVMNEPLLTTRLVPGEPLRESYSGNGGYSGEDDDAYIEFVQSVMNNEFPPGYYTLSGYADFTAINTDNSSKHYTIPSQIDFKVVPKN
ncbi:hypothetical protein FQV26_14915 [Planococcus sp. CPCC 101016]|uniref:hypothetical protein n=1 Tax=Planococcus sp. CPCC 101016 TaxID=2599617 RepID=UPI0011B58879|nr:hypothetical protein [Planococcus sp. CPCC 101016]TWT04514.1 hypothetical protein FQV26_14915 [Planococcus sp. CPCC 101016]